MGKNSSISWTHHTFNPWIGCAKVNDGCKFCYAEAIAEHYGHAVWGVNGTRHITSDQYWKQPAKWNKRCEQLGIRERVFCASMADIFEDRNDLLEVRARLWSMIEQTPNLDWLILTKRTEIKDSFARMPGKWIKQISCVKNLWLGFSASYQKYYDENNKNFNVFGSCHPARISFISFEPLLGNINIHKEHLPDWIIIGGESGPVSKVRKLNLYHVKHLIEQIQALDIPCPPKIFFKQLGSVLAKAYKLQDRKGEDFNEYPAHLDWLKIREIPFYEPQTVTV